MATYTRSHDFSADATFNKAALETEIAAIIAAANSIDNSQRNTTAGNKLSARKLAYPFVVSADGGYFDVRQKQRPTTGQGRAFFVVTGGSNVEGAIQQNATGFGIALSDTSASVIADVVAVIRPPSWTASGAVTPSVTLTGFACTTAHWVSPETAAKQDTVFATPAAICADMIARIYRVPWSKVRTLTSNDSSEATHTFINTIDIDAMSLVAETQGLTYRKRPASVPQAPVAAALLSNFQTSSALPPAGGHEAFQASWSMGPSHLGRGATITQDEAFIVMITGTTDLLAHGNPFTVNFGASVGDKTFIIPSIFPMCGGWYYAITQSDTGA